MWMPQNRKRYDRSRLRYPSDLTDEEWTHVAPVVPPAKHGNKRTVDVREVMNGVSLPKTSSIGLAVSSESEHDR